MSRAETTRPTEAIIPTRLTAEFRQLAFPATACRATEQGRRLRLQSGRLATVMPAIPRPVGVEASCG